MRILIVHNRYQSPGGEDSVVNAEIQLLKDFGHDVSFYERHNSEINSLRFFQKIQYLREMIWSPKTYRDIKDKIKELKPQIVHFHNIFFLVTPSAYYACREEGVPVVQTQHNFRLLCSNALFYRDHRACEDCLKKSLWQGVYHRCYRGSFFLTTALVKMLRTHWKKRTWIDLIDANIVLSQFSRQKFIQAGIPEEKIFVKPNFTPSPPVFKRQDHGYALYIGRLSEEKGVKFLLEAWRSVKLPLKIIGDGPLREEMERTTHNQSIKNVEFLGHCSSEKCQEYMQTAKLLLVPSQCYENFPRVIAEAFSCGVPVVASRLGSLAEIVEDGKTGILFEPQDIASFIQKIDWAMTHEKELNAMGANARRIFEERYTAEQNYQQLMKIYQNAILLSKKRIEKKYFAQGRKFF